MPMRLQRAKSKTFENSSHVLDFEQEAAEVTEKFFSVLSGWISPVKIHE